MADKERHGSFEDVELGVGQNADGTFETFPVEDLLEKTMERDAGEAASAHAYEQSEAGFPEEEDPDEVGDISDLDDLDELMNEDDHL